MKTIEEASKEYAGISEDKYSNKALKYCSFDISYAFKAGVEFAQRWIPVEEELPPFKRVLLKSETGYVDARTIHNYQIHNGKSNIYIGNHLATHWRLIEIK